MRTRFWALALASLLSTSALADPPPSTAPAYRPNVSLQPVSIYDAAGNVVSAFGGGGTGGGASTVTGSMEQDVRSTGTLDATSTSSAIIIPVNGQSTVGLRFSGLTASGATVTFEQSNDGGTTYTGVNEVNAGTGVPAATRAVDGQTRVAVQGRTNLRLRISAVGTGTVSVAWNVSVREGLVTLASPLPPGSNPMGFAGSGQYNATLPTLATGAYGYLAVDSNGRLIQSPGASVTIASGAVTVANPTAVGSVTAPGTAGTAAQAVQGIANGIPQNGYVGQYNATLPTLTSGQNAYASLDANGRQILAPTSSVSISNFPAQQGVAGNLNVYPTVTGGTGGVVGFSRIVSSAASTNATQAKTATGRLYKIFACNTTTTAAFIKFYNTASAPTVGTTTVLFSRPVPAASTAGGLACVSYDMAGIGWSFTAGIAYALTTGSADSDTTALAAGQLTQVSVEYQ